MAGGAPEYEGEGYDEDEDEESDEATEPGSVVATGIGTIETT